MRYQLGDLIVDDGASRRFAARDTTDGRAVLVEIFLSDPDAEPRLRRAFEACSAIRSEHALRMLDVGTTEQGQPFVVWQEAGESLASVLVRGGPLAPHAAADFVRQAMHALAEAHEASVFHLDFKPAALLLSEEKSIRVIGIGSAAAAHAKGEHWGSPLYMAPERLRKKAVAASCDVWSAGATLYELVTRRPPFTGASMSELFVAILSKPPAPMNGPAALEAVVLSCLEKDPAKRPSARSLVDALRPFAS